MLDEPRPPFDDDIVRYYGEIRSACSRGYLRRGQSSRGCRRRVLCGGNCRMSIPTCSPRKPERSLANVASMPRWPTWLRFDHVIDAHYAISPETHNPIETHATVVGRYGDELTLYETSQGVVNHRNVLADMLGLPRLQGAGDRQVHRFGIWLLVVAVVPTSSGRGGGDQTWPADKASAEPADDVPQPWATDRVPSSAFASAASVDGRLMSFQHDYVDADVDHKTTTRRIVARPRRTCTVFPISRVTSGLAKCATSAHRRLCAGRARCLDCSPQNPAMDELAIKLGLDPVELRLINEPQLDESLGVPFSSRHLKECVTLGAEKFGWFEPYFPVCELSMKRDGQRLWDGAWPHVRGSPRDRIAPLRSNCVTMPRSRVASVCLRISGTGTYTVMAQMVAEMLGIAIETRRGRNRRQRAANGHRFPEVP